VPANIGNQTVSIIFFAPGQSSIVNRRHKSIRMLGIYSGGYVSFTPGINNVNISPLVCEVTDGTHQVRVQTTSTVNIAVTSVNLYVVLRWNYTGSTSDYMEILAVSTPATNDLIVGKCSFSGSPPTLQGFSYEERTTPNTHDLFLKVEPTGETELRVRIRAGRIQTTSADIDIVDQKSDLFTLPSANSKVYLVYIDSNGTVQIDSSGTEAVNPVPPNYKGKLVLAEVTLSSTDTNITKDKIKNVRGFISRPIDVDNSTIEFDFTTGKLKVKGISGSQISSLFGSWTDKDSLGNSLVKNNVYKVTSDGEISVYAFGAHGGGGGVIKTDSNNPPTTARTGDGAGYCDYHMGFTCRVKKDNYWKIETTGNFGTSILNIYWLPVGSGQCVKQ